MAKYSAANKALPTPAAKAIKLLAQDIATARVRRRIPQRLLAERMMVTLQTLQRLEHGDPGVSLGVLATALWALGLIEGLSTLASFEHDTIGKTEELRRLPRRAHAPKSNSDLDF